MKLENVLEIKGLSKRFGEKEVLDGLNMEVPEHSVFGFLGLNGAGKTTTMKLVLGLLKADAGEIRVCGERACYGETRTNRLVGYLPDVPEFYGYMRPVEYLKLCGEIAGIDHRSLRSRSGELLDMVGLSREKHKIAGFSRGQKQRLGIAQALLGEPRLLICDEPTSALDPVGRKEILEVLERLRGRMTVVFSTHILGDAQRICDRVAILAKGKIQIGGTLEEIRKRRKTGSVLLEFSAAGEKERFLAGGQGLEVVSQTRRSVTVKAEDGEKQRGLLGVLMESGLTPQKYEVLEPDLEDLFLETV